MLVLRYMEAQTIFINIYEFPKGLSRSNSLITEISMKLKEKKKP